MQTSELIELIDRTLVDIWKNEIKSDYECGWLLKEDTLKNALFKFVHGVAWSLLYCFRRMEGRCGGFDAYDSTIK